jgi:hypothetical protein
VSRWGWVAASIGTFALGVALVVAGGALASLVPVVGIVAMGVGAIGMPLSLVRLLREVAPSPTDQARGRLDIVGWFLIAWSAVSLWTAVNAVALVVRSTGSMGLPMQIVTAVWGAALAAGAAVTGVGVLKRRTWARPAGVVLFSFVLLAMVLQALRFRAMPLGLAASLFWVAIAVAGVVYFALPSTRDLLGESTGEGRGPAA